MIRLIASAVTSWNAAAYDRFKTGHLICFYGRQQMRRPMRKFDALNFCQGQLFWKILYQLTRGTGGCHRFIVSSARIDRLYTTMQVAKVFPVSLSLAANPPRVTHSSEHHSLARSNPPLLCLPHDVCGHPDVSSPSPDFALGRWSRTRHSEM